MCTQRAAGRGQPGRVAPGSNWPRPKGQGSGPPGLYRDWGTKFTKYRAQFFLSAVHFASPHFATRPAVRSARMTTAAQQDVDNAFYAHAHARHT